MKTMAADGKTEIFLQKWPSNLATLVDENFDSKRTLGRMAKTSAFQTLCDVASEVRRSEFPAESTMASSLARPARGAPRSATSATTRGKQRLRGGTSRASALQPGREETTPPKSQGEVSSHATSRSSRFSSTEEDNQFPRPARGMKRSRGGGEDSSPEDAAHSKCDELCKRVDALMAEAQSLDRQETSQSSMIEWRDRAYACLVRVPQNYRS